MARKRDPRRDEAFELFKKSNGSITNREIAEKLSVPEKRSPLGNREINGMQYYKTIIVVLQKMIVVLQTEAALLQETKMLKGIKETAELHRL